MCNSTKLLLKCSDNELIDAKPFVRESRVLPRFYEDGREHRVEGNSDIIKKAAEFCLTRAQIQDDTTKDEITIQKELDDYSLQFRRSCNRSQVIPLIIAAFSLMIESLIDVMLKDVDDVFTGMTDDEVYDILPVNLRNYDEFQYQMMVEYLRAAKWDFKTARKA
ncbi:uncharacterized protein [Rutidosis leptorrhynchoides]|uniref:uncharacterized protein n=1 Tax=Rutidosis leptorrhynchoides TaxID=125765 RepID=UPI003A995C36